ncbi:MAG TPA: CoA-binding protein [Blastocatellia bacterium]
MDINSNEAIDSILDTCKVIAVVGLSSNPSRVSHAVSSYMRSNGYTIVPVNPNETSVLGEKAYSSLAEIPQNVDLVNVFRRSEEAGAHVDEAIGIKARAVWLQEGVIDHPAAKRARDAGLMVVMDRCILKEHLSRGGR